MSTAQAEERFLAELRERVGWQARVAEEQRAAERARPPLADPMDAATLRRLVEAHPGHARAEEWRVLLDELEPLAEGGRLPSMLERLVLVVFADVL